MALLTAPITTGQISFFVAFLWSVVAWLYAEGLHWARVANPSPHETEEARHHRDDAEVGATAALQAATANGGEKAGAAGGAAANGEHGGKAAGGGGGSKPEPMAVGDMLGSVGRCGLLECLRLDKAALLQHRLVLRAAVEFGVLMAWYFLSDRTTILGTGEKTYSRDLFFFLFVILTCVAVGCSLQAFKTPVLLNRPQTEEWKGWMQVLFLLYHYYEAKEVYNAIRIFIAAYVWMTGFGNFSYYYKTGDFSIGRFAQMLWRLNFLVFFACVVLNNSYMLYYICPMHTIYTVFVYLALAIAPRLNQKNAWIWIKLALCLLLIVVLWDIKAVFYAVWGPFSWLLGYTDPRNPGGDVLHEWYFRSGLDRYIWIYGMLCAFVHPQAAAILKYIDDLPPLRRLTVRSLVLAACGAAAYLYTTHIFLLPKLEYNKVHPYTSWIPITLWMVVRNITANLRIYHLRLYGWLGCITLETYICQFHVWMKTEVPDGQPKSLLVLLPGYPMLNFALVTALYIFVSHRLFELTNSLKNAAVPHSDNVLLLRNTVLLLVSGAALWGGVAVLYYALVENRRW